MTEDDKLLLFLPIMVAQYTNAVYSCQLMNPEMKHNPEAALQHVLLTADRVRETVTAELFDRLDKNVGLAKRLSDLLAIERSKMSEQMEYLCGLDPSQITPDTEREKRELRITAEAMFRFTALLMEAAGIPNRQEKN